jgi:hypothetical protein
VELRLLKVDDPSWHSAVSHGGCDFYHLPAYAALCASLLADAEPAALCITEGESRFLLPMLLRPVPHMDPIGYRDATSPYGYPGPLVSHDGGQPPGQGADFLRRAVALMMDRLRELRVISVFTRFHPLLPIDLAPFREMGRLILHGETVAIDLRLDEAAIWGGMRANHRSGIRRSEAAGYEVVFDADLDYLDIFIAAYQQTMDRVQASREYYFPRGYYAKLREMLDGGMHLVLVRIAGRFASAALFTEVDGILQYHLGGTFDESMSLHSHKLLFHRVALWGRKRGCRWLHLGGGVGGGEDSLFHFKAGFSPSRHPFHTWRLICDRGVYERLSGDGGLDAEYFPAYRRKARSEVKG